MSTNDLPDTGDRPVCADCIGESYLSIDIERTGTPGECHYCGAEGQTVTIEMIASRVERAMKEHFERTARDPEGYEYYIQRETGDWDRSGEPVADVIAQLLDADEAIAEDVRETLDDWTSDFDGIAAGEEQPFDSEAHYQETTSVDHSTISAEYIRFESTIVDQARFFSPESRRFLSSLFESLADLRAHNGRPVLVDAGPGETISGFFRARVFQDDERLKRALLAPAAELSPPPRRMGRAGRLNAAGVSIFYGADTEDVAIAEVRPPVGSKVAMAQFELLRPVRLLDIDALKSLLVEGSYFDPTHATRLQHAAFLRSFSWRFTQPVMPDHEAYEYIPTQAVADFLANEVEPRLDGILYSSPQSASEARNVALFHRSSRVERPANREAARRDVWLGYHDDEGDVVDYTIMEQVPASTPSPSPQPAALDDGFGFDPHLDPDPRPFTLRIKPDSLRVLHVNTVSVIYESFPVRTSRLHTRQEDF